MSSKRFSRIAVRFGHYMPYGVIEYLLNALTYSKKTQQADRLFETVRTIYGDVGKRNYRDAMSTEELFVFSTNPTALEAGGRLYYGAPYTIALSEVNRKLGLPDCFIRYGCSKGRLVGVARISPPTNYTRYVPELVPPKPYDMREAGFTTDLYFVYTTPHREGVLKSFIISMLFEMKQKLSFRGVVSQVLADALTRYGFTRVGETNGLPDYYSAGYFTTT